MRPRLRLYVLRIWQMVTLIPPHAHRANASLKGLGKREGAVRKQPFHPYMHRWRHIELICKFSMRDSGRGSAYTNMYNARIHGFISPLRISEPSAITWVGITVDTRDNQLFLSIEIKKSKTDVSLGGVAHHGGVRFGFAPSKNHHGMARGRFPNRHLAVGYIWCKHTRNGVFHYEDS